MKNQTPQRQYKILKEKIQAVTEEIEEMGIRYNQAPVNQTALITIPNHGTSSTPNTRLNPPTKPVTRLNLPSKPVTPPDPTIEEQYQSGLNKQKEITKKLKEIQEEEQERKETSLEEISTDETNEELKIEQEELEKLEKRLEDFKERYETEIQQQKELDYV